LPNDYDLRFTSLELNFLHQVVMFAVDFNQTAIFKLIVAANIIKSYGCEDNNFDLATKFRNPEIFSLLIQDILNREPLENSDLDIVVKNIYKLLQNNDLKMFEAVLSQHLDLFVNNTAAPQKNYLKKLKDYAEKIIT